MFEMILYSKILSPYHSMWWWVGTVEALIKQANTDFKINFCHISVTHIPYRKRILVLMAYLDHPHPQAALPFPESVIVQWRVYRD